ncbi:MAG: phytase [Prolixibacteraceae bacterium]|jgi:3-phytase|nr:phytase [Prolixibacteraceae bacterium]
MKKRDLYISALFLSIVGYAACTRMSEGSKKESEKIKLVTMAKYETAPVPQQYKDDAADDPAIWFNVRNPEESRIIGTDKKGGLAVYNLGGEQLFYYPDGQMNNADLRYGFVLGNDTVDVLCASNRSNQGISIYRINSDGSLANITVRTIVSQMQGEVYGLCMYKSPVNNHFYAFVNSKKGEVEQWELFSADTLVDARIVRSFRLNTKVEGMVADDENQTLFIGKEVNGIWTFDAEPDGDENGSQIEKSSEADNENIGFDIEGLAIYYLPDGAGYLLASSQGNYSYAVYERKIPCRYIGSFRITDGVVDGVEETDGIDIFSFPLNGDFKHGLVVVQDGYNYDEKYAKAQNFKLADWENIARLFSPALQMN